MLTMSPLRSSRQFELDDAKLLAESLHADMTVLPFDVLTDKVVKSNPKDRCYYCKNQVFGGILKAAKEDGFTEIMDGTNASDDAGDRPGMRALKEMKVLSPLRLSGITKTALGNIPEMPDYLHGTSPPTPVLRREFRREFPSKLLY